MQSPYKLGGRAVAVPFGKMGHSSSPYLIPSQVFVDRTDTVRLTSTDGATTVRHLKVGILDRLIGGGSGPAEEFAKDLVACTIGYIALVLREARKWLLTSQTESYGEDHILWSVNLGIPSAGYDDEQIRAEYETLAKAAWLASLDDRPLRMGSIQDALQRARADRKCAGIPIEVVPEVAAQVVGYAKSRLREEGLHVLADLGASTLDICSFILPLGLLGVDGKPLAPAIFNRLNVAYGLSFAAINIGTIERPSDVSDIYPPRRQKRWEDGFVGKDQV